jgi:predicted phage terminase large subunit-like protein
MLNNAQMLSNASMVFQPQPGAQTAFLRTPADIAIFGGAAGGGKSYALLLETLRHHRNPKMRSVVFRREGVQITNPGALWDEASQIYPYFNATSNKQALEWVFPSGFKSKFAHLQHEQDVHKWHGAQIPFIGFDELTHFTADMFWYMFSRNRSDSGVPGYIRATCNPPDGVNPQEMWVAELIDWWLTPDGYPDPLKAGVIRWLARRGNVAFWASSPKELMDKHDFERIDCKSFTFIPATIEDNQILLQNDPAYLSNLRALNENDKNRLLYGNWRVSSAGTIFSQKSFKHFTTEPSQIDYRLITVDTAQKIKEHNDYTVFQLWGLSGKNIYLLDQVRGKFEYPQLKMMAAAFFMLHADYDMVLIEDTVSGSALIQDLLGDNRFHNIIPINRKKDPTGRVKDKLRRAYDGLPYVTGGYVYINPTKDYYPEFVQEVVAFRGDLKHPHDDQVDCMLDAIDTLLINPPPIVKYKRAAANAPLLCRKIA